MPWSRAFNLVCEVALKIVLWVVPHAPITRPVPTVKLLRFMIKNRCWSIVFSHTYSSRCRRMMPKVVGVISSSLPVYDQTSARMRGTVTSETVERLVSCVFVKALFISMEGNSKLYNNRDPRYDKRKHSWVTCPIAKCKLVIAFNAWEKSLRRMPLSYMFAHSCFPYAST